MELLSQKMSKSSPWNWTVPENLGIQTWKEEYTKEKDWTEYNTNLKHDTNFIIIDSKKYK